MHKEKYKDIYAGAFILILGAALFAASFSVPRGAAVTIGSDFMPKVTCGLMTVLGLFIMWNGARSAKTFQENGTEPETKHYKALLASIGMLFFYMLLLVPVGFVIMTALYVTAQTMVLAPREKRNLAKFAAVGIIASAVIYYIFRNVFVLMLPAGILKFLG
ncbi:tripartite tricarboxylate transporter TctB family protein [Clostridium sp. AM58-1XD]|uniref:tripartite tricarboxylate transporter TctB family protein n=1 Tax=Clostridium sp. AM58-1XD TaxID=2292307 RepID=UPI000E54B9A0|nr:tripartite tricarboxylate transporter TctB family protein [Clostridium sp. AM58-1XD]RGZ00396.1 tripartite tricarboxylate transporter TctB family protein [Clostridium sp. AM58-1XD]